MYIWPLAIRSEEITGDSMDTDTQFCVLGYQIMNSLQGSYKLTILHGKASQLITEHARARNHDEREKERLKHVRA